MPYHFLISVPNIVSPAPSTVYGKDGDPTDSLSRYQASLEARCYDNMETARALWVEVMSRHGKQAQYWIEYASIERYIGVQSILNGHNLGLDGPISMI